VIYGLSKSSNCDDLGCIYFKVIYLSQSFSNGLICSCKIYTDKCGASCYISFVHMLQVVGSATRRQPTVAEMSKLEAEINFLKRSLDVSTSNIFGLIMLQCGDKC